MEEDVGSTRQRERAGVKRPYRMRERRRSVERTREGILQAAFGLWLARPYDEVTLDAVAGAAGVSRQTVHRQFGSKEDLMVAVIDWRRPREHAADQQVEPGDTRAAVAQLVERYEAMGDAIVRFLEIEGRIDAIDYLLQQGRDAHRQWIERVFDAFLPADPVEREEAVLALYAATDVMVWKLLRHDFRRSRHETEASLRRLVQGVLLTLEPREREDPP
jgi:AcrR family transcriptional regulator